MLTLDLVRARLVDGIVRPGYVDADAARLRRHAEELTALFRSIHGGGGSQGELDEALADYLSEGGDLKIRKGLAKLLRDRCTFAAGWTVPPDELRREVFLEAGRQHPVGTGRPGDREQVLCAVAARHGVDAAALEGGLYADLRDAQRLTAFDEPAPGDLLRRYNLALAQGVLLRATRVRVEIAGCGAPRYRQLFRYVKFFQLSFSAEPLPASGYRIELDGPLSLFRLVQRYGLQLANFLPALLLVPDGWELEADVDWPHGRERRARFRLSPQDGLRSHYRNTGVWRPEEQSWFAQRFRARKGDWSLVAARRVVSLGGKDVFVPDYVLRHADGREALLEIVWSWRRRGLDRHLELLAKHGPKNLVLAVSERLRVGEADTDRLPPGSVRFKQVLRPEAVEKAAELVAL